VNGKELHEEIVRDLKSAKDKILRMQREELYRDLGCNTFTEYLDRYLKDVPVLALLKWNRAERQELSGALYQGGKSQQQVANTLGVTQSTISSDLQSFGIIEKNNSSGRPRKETQELDEPEELVEVPSPAMERGLETQDFLRVKSTCLRLVTDIRTIQKRHAPVPEEFREALAQDADRVIMAATWLKDVCEGKDLDSELARLVGGIDE